MKILFYTHFFKPETGAASVRADYFVKALRSGGNDVLVVSPKPNYPIGKIFDGYKGKFSFKDEERNVIYLPILFVGSHSPSARLFSYLSYFCFSLFYLLFNKYKPDAVITSSPPIFTSFAAAIYSRIKKIKLIFDIRDIWPDIGIELGIIKNRFFVKGLKKIEKFILDSASFAVVTALGDKKNIENKTGKKNRCEIIYNGADTNIFKPVSEDEKNEIRKKYDLPIEKKILIYFGSYNHGMNDIQVLAEFLSSDKLMKYDIFFLSIGSGDNLEFLLNKIKGKIEYKSIKSLPMESVARLVAASDISIIPRKNIGKDTGGNIPVKCFESWAAGVPVLLSNIADAEISKIFNRCGAGVLARPGSAESLITAFEKILASDLIELGIKGREFTVKNFDRIKQSEKLLTLIDEEL